MKRPAQGSRRRFLGLAGTAGIGVPYAAAAADGGTAAARGRRGGSPLAAGAAGGLDVRAFGAVGDGKTPATQALQAAIDACAAAGGGTVLIPAGRYLSGALFLRSHVHLLFSTGATLMASQRPEDFPAS